MLNSRDGKWCKYSHALDIACICSRYIDTKGAPYVTTEAVKPLLTYLKEHYATNNPPNL